MDGNPRSAEIEWKARCMARICARWLRKIGRPVDAAQRRELEVDLASLLARYRNEWGVNVVGLRLDPAGVTFQRSFKDNHPDT